MYVLHQKIKNTCKKLSSWSRHAFGDIYEEPKRLEAQRRAPEDISIHNNSTDNKNELSRCRAEYMRYIKLQDSILRQKARVKWLEKGDANTAYFQSIIEDNRKRLNIRKTKDDENQWLQGNNAIAEGAVTYFKTLLL